MPKPNDGMHAPHIDTADSDASQPIQSSAHAAADMVQLEYGD